MPKTKIVLADGNELELDILGTDKYGRFKDRVLTAYIYPFSALDWLIAEINMYRKNDMDTAILVTGEERTGKSTVCYHIADKLGLESKDYINFQATQLLACMRWAPDGSVIWEDEAGASMYASEWWGYYQRQIAKAFQVIGTKKYTFLLALPHRGLLLKKIRDTRVRYWLHTYIKTSRPKPGKPMRIIKGFCRIRKARRSEWSDQPYWNPIFTVRFPGAKGPLWDEYLIYKRENIDKVLETKESRAEEIHKIADYRFIWKLAKFGLNGQTLTHNEIADLRGCSRQYISQIIAKIEGDPELKEAVIHEH